MQAKNLAFFTPGTTRLPWLPRSKMAALPSFRETHLTIDEMRKTMRDFAETSGDSEITVIYYAGHGIEIDGTNYLLPVDAKLAREIDVER
jgi:hypothetical protein